jgi:toxin-antitoxin system PIN domain toxin
MVLSGFLRVVTHPRVFKEPTPPEIALEFAERLRGSPAADPLAPGERHWGIFVDLCRRTRAIGNVVPDAYLAALAIEHRGTWITADRAFARFPGLRWENPLDA